MRTAVRYLKRTLGALGLALMIAIAALFVYTRTRSFNELLRAKLTGYMMETYRGEITLDQIDAPLFGPVTINQLVVRYHNAEAARIAKVRVSYSLLPLLWGAVHLDAAVFKPVINISRGSDGQWNLLEALSPKVPGPPGSPISMSIHLDAITVRDGSVELAPEGTSGARYRLRNTAIDLSAAILPSGMRVSIFRLKTQIEAPGFPATAAEGSLIYQDVSAPASVEISHFKLTTQDSMVAIAGTLADFDQMNVNAELKIKKLAASDLARILPDYRINQDLTGTLTLKGPRRALDAGLALEAGKARIGAHVLADLTAKAPRYDARVTVSNLDARTLLGAAYPSGLIGGSITAHGTGTALANVAGEARIKDRGVVANGLRLGDATLNATIRNGRAQFDAAVNNGPSRVTANGTAQVSADPRYRVTVAASHVDLRRILTGRATHASDLNFTVVLDGGGLAPARMNTAVRIRLTASTIAQFAAADGAVDARIANGRVIVSRATMTSQGAVFNSNGTVGLARNAPAQLSYQLRAASLAPWLKLAGLAGDGGLAINGTASGRLGDIRAKGTLTADKLRTGGESVAYAEINYDFSGIGQTIPYGTLDAGMDDVAASIRLRRLDAKLEVGRGTPVPLNFTLTARDSAGGHHAIAADFVWRPGQIAGRLTQAELALPDGVWRMETPAAFSETARGVTLTAFSLRNRDRTLALNGSLTWNGPQHFVLNADRIDLADFKSIVPQAQQLGGTLGLEVRISGTAAAPIIDARLVANKIKMNAQRLGDLDLKAGYATDTMTIDAAMSQDARHRLTATGTLPATLQWANGFKARIGGDIDLRVYSAGVRLGPLAAFAPATVKDVAGLLAIDLTLGGPVERPHANGTIALNGGRAQIVPLGVTITDVASQVRVSQDELQVAELTAQSGDGTLAGNGKVALSNYAPGEINAHLNFHHWPAIDTSQYQATIDGQITAKGTADAPRIGGRIDVMYALLRPDLGFLAATSDIAPDPTIIVIQPGEKPPPRRGAGVPGSPRPLRASRPPSTFNQTAINVKVEIHRDSWISHEDAAVELEGELNILKQPAEMVHIIGVIQTVRGWINFQNRRFDLARGTISFTGGDQIDPSLDIDAQYKVTNYIIDVLIGGTANKPSLKLSSQPELPQADILSLLLFGKTTTALGQGQQATLQQQAASMAAGYAASSIGQAVAQSLGLQALGLQMSGISSSGSMIGFGHYLTQNAYVSVSQRFGASSGDSGGSTQGVSVQYYILSWLSIKSTSYSDGSREIDLNLTRQY